VVSRREVLTGTGAALGLAALGSVTRHLPKAAAASPYSVVVVLVDDMRFDYRGLLSVFATGPWVDCTSAAAQTPMCAPSRASLFTGANAWRTPVISDPTSPGMKQLEADTVATRLRSVGYRTALVGKYQNQYPWDLGSSYVPPGWTDWNAVQSVNWKPKGLHETDYCFKWASEYVRAATAPFLLWVAPRLPHEPFTPPARHQNAMPPVPPEPPNVNEADVSDKPKFVRRKPLLTPAQLDTYRTQRLLQARDMLSIDEGMSSLMAALAQSGRLESTVVIFTSDNSLVLGEHRLDNKGFVYEEAVRVPFVVRYPGVARRQENQPISLVDVPATLCAIASPGLQAPGPDGVSLVELLTHGTRARDGVYITPPRDLTWEGVRTETHKYAEHKDGFRELYDLRADPYELTNVAGRSDTAAVQEQLRLVLQGLRP
jgi:N-acetylglucosamine-6-sulfatase